MKKLVTALAMLVLMAGLLCTPALADEPDSTNGPEGVHIDASPFTCTGVEQVAVIQDKAPWNTGSHGAIYAELQAQGISSCIVNTVGIQDGTVDLAQFPVAIIASDQDQATYNRLFPGGVVHSALVTYVQNGGILSANLCDAAWNRGNWTGATFIGGLQKGSLWHPNDLSIAAPSHPLILNAQPCSSGNCGQIVDQGWHNDLDSWGDSAHSAFTNLPQGTTVILNSPQGPVMIEYPFGEGTVIASTTVTEFMYLFGNRKLLANDIAYQVSLAAEPTAIDLASFGARAGAEDVTVAWETGSEVDNAGFNVYRAESADGPYVQVNQTLIPAQGDPVGGASYSLQDAPGVGAFYYKLQDVDLSGVRTEHGPIKIIVMPSVRLPLVRPVVPF
jgi:hypothetical protein